MRSQPPSFAFNKVRLGFGIVCVLFLAIAGAGPASATPFTEVSGIEQIDGPDGSVVQNGFDLVGHGLILDLGSLGRSFSDGSHADAFSAASADFGELGVGVSGEGTTPPIPKPGIISFPLAQASWDDTFTPRAPFLPAGTPVMANLLLNLDFANEAQRLNAVIDLSYELTAKIVQRRGSRLVERTLVDACFVTLGASCDSSSRFLIPGNGGLNLGLAPIPLSLAIDQPFRLIVGLTGDGGGTSPRRAGFIGAYNFSGDALDTSDAFLQPLQDFTLVSESGHDYSPGGGHTVPEPSSLALLFAGLLSAVRWRRSARSRLRSGSRL